MPRTPAPEAARPGRFPPRDARAAARTVGLFAQLCVGLLIFSLGLVLTVQAGIGLGPWWALHFGLTRHLPITIGQASMLVGLVMVGLGWFLGVRPGVATACNVVLTGLATDALLAWGGIPLGSGGPDSYVLMALGLLVIGLGTALYVKVGWGAGPRDGFMLGLAPLLHGRVSVARNAMELVATLTGWQLGAPIGLGTLIFALGLGPAIGLWFRCLRVHVRKRSG